MNLKTLRKAHGLTQVELAKKMKMKQAYIAQLESGTEDNPTLSTLQRLAKALKVPVGELLKESRGRRAIAMTTYDVHPYEANKKWHYIILQLPAGSAGASSIAYDSQAHNRQGYITKEEAQKAGLAHKTAMP